MVFPWSIGIMEYWNVVFAEIGSIDIAKPFITNKLVDSIPFSTQYSIFPSFHYSILVPNRIHLSSWNCNDLKAALSFSCGHSVEQLC
jgi:hypothetical protein